MIDSIYILIVLIIIGSVISIVIGYKSGKSPYAHHGWEINDIDQYFKRYKFEVNKPTYNILTKTKRPTGLQYVFTRRDDFRKYLINYDPNKTTKELLNELGIHEPSDKRLDIFNNEDIIDFYKSTEDLNYFYEDIKFFLEVIPLHNQINEEVQKYGDDILHRAFFNGFTSLEAMFRGESAPKAVTSKEYDFENVNVEKYIVKDKKEMSKLIKKVSTLYGAPIVRITKLNHDFVYNTHPGGRGYKRNEKIDVPNHWKYAIVIGTPMEWDSFKANPSYGHSYDAYMKVTIFAERLTTYIKNLGYPARPSSPFHNYDLMVPPIAVDAGVGEQGRTGTCISPDFGGNLRLAVVVTDLPLEIDKPIDVGIKKFCEVCKICAEQCPSQSISHEGVKEISNRGYEGWCINNATCHNYWTTVPFTNSCRICIAVCPFSKESGWIHKLARDVAVRDKTRISHHLLTWMEKNFFGQKQPYKYWYKLGSRDYPHIKEIPWWLNPSNFFKKGDKDV